MAAALHLHGRFRVLRDAHGADVISACAVREQEALRAARGRELQLDLREGGAVELDYEGAVLIEQAIERILDLVKNASTED